MKDMPAFPVIVQMDRAGEPSRHFKGADGLTKREYIATAALQGLLSGNDPRETAWMGSPNSRELSVWVADTAVYFADALLAELSKEKSHE